MTESTATAVPPATMKSSVWEDFIDIFYAPSQVYARRENNGFGLALFILTVAYGLLFFAVHRSLEPIFEAEMMRAMQAGAGAGREIPPDQLAMVRRIGAITAPILASITVCVLILLFGVVMWMVGKLFDSRQTMRSAMVVSTYSSVPQLLMLVAWIIQGLLLDTSTFTSLNQVSVGPGRFLDPQTSSPVLQGVLSRLDLFTIWWAVLAAIGIKVTGKVSMPRAAAVVAVLWLLGTVMAVWQAYRATV